jgi:hypothetical protein
MGIVEKARGQRETERRVFLHLPKEALGIERERNNGVAGATVEIRPSGRQPRNPEHVAGHQGLDAGRLPAGPLRFDRDRPPADQEKARFAITFACQEFSGTKSHVLGASNDERDLIGLEVLQERVLSQNAFEVFHR